jgi:predicted restriction endonuclease
MPTTTAVAWITTAESPEYAPEVTITDKLLDDSSFEIVEQYRLGAYAALTDGRLRLATEGWRVIGEAVAFDHGRYTVIVEKI